MKYVLKIDSRDGHEKVEIFAPQVGMKLTDDEARRVLRYAAQDYGIHEQELHTRRGTAYGRG